MKLAVETKIEIPDSITYFDNFSVGVEQGGVRIKAKSPTFAKWIRDTQIQRLPDDSPKMITERGVWQPEGDTSKLYYAPLNQWVGGDSKWGFAPAYQVTSDFFFNAHPNLTWLFHKDLETGMDLLVRQPISLNNWEDYFTACCRSIQDIWSTELRQCSISAVFRELRG